MNIKRAIKKELKRARKKHPKWPTDIIHQVAVIGEEAGEALQAALQYVYENGNRENIDQEVTQCIVTCIRFLERK